MSGCDVQPLSIWCHNNTLNVVVERVGRYCKGARLLPRPCIEDEHLYACAIAPDRVKLWPYRIDRKYRWIKCASRDRPDHLVERRIDHHDGAAERPPAGGKARLIHFAPSYITRTATAKKIGASNKNTRRADWDNLRGNALRNGVNTSGRLGTRGWRCKFDIVFARKAG